MFHLDTFVARLAAGRRGPAVLITIALVVVGMGALIANPSGAPGASARPSISATAGQSTQVETLGPTGSPVGMATIAPSLGGLVPADLDGVLVAPNLAHRLPLAVSIDDSRPAR